MPKTISSAVTWWAKTTPDVTVVAVDDDRVSFREFDLWVNAIGADLIARGTGPGDRVAGLAHHSTAYCALAFAVVRIGCIFVPFGLRLTQFELREIADNVKPSLCFADASSLVKAKEALGDILPMESLQNLRGKYARCPVATDASAPVVIICTSGSTGRPKGVTLTNASLIESATQYALEDASCRAGARKLLVAPMSVSASCVQMFIFMSIGCTLFFDSSFDAERTLKILVNEKIALFGAAPIFLDRIAALPEFEDADLSSITYAYSGGATVEQKLLEKWHAKGVVFRQMYGITECGGMATIMPRELALQFPEKCGPGRIFNTIKVVDGNGNETGLGIPGEILLRTPDMMLGYWNNPEATAEAIQDGWLYTGDIGVKDEQGMLTFVDRKKDLIISGGMNIAAAEVERAVSDFPGIEEVAVIAACDPKFGETPMAVIYARDEIIVADLILHCNERLSDYKVPRYVILHGEPLPRLSAGKISKPAIRELYRGAEATLPRVR